MRELNDEELSALALIDDGAEIEEAVAATGLTRERIIAAAGVRERGGGVTIVAVAEAGDAPARVTGAEMRGFRESVAPPRAE